MSGFSHPLEDLIICAFAIWLGRRRGVAFGTPVRLDVPRPGAGQTKMPDYLIPGTVDNGVLVEMKRVGPSLERHAKLERFVRDTLKTTPGLAPAHYDFLFIGGHKGIPNELPTARKARRDEEEVRQFREDISRAATSASIAEDGSCGHEGPPRFSVYRSPGDLLSAEVRLFPSTDEDGLLLVRCKRFIGECEQKFEAASQEHAASTRAALFLSYGVFSTGEAWSELHRLYPSGKMNHTTDVYSVHVADTGLSIQQFWPYGHGNAGTLYPVARLFFLKEWHHLLYSYFGG